MEFLNTVSIPPGELDGYERRTMPSSNQGSLYYIIGYSILKLVIRAKRHPEFAQIWPAFIYQKLPQAYSCAASLNMTDSLKLFQQALDIFSNNPNPIEVYGWLKAYTVGNYANVQKAIIDAGHVFAYIAVKEKDQNLNEIINNEGAKVLEYTSQFLSIYIRLLWNNGSYIYQVLNKAKSFIIDVHFDVTTQGFSLLHHKLESDEETNPNFLMDVSPFIYPIEVSVKVPEIVAPVKKPPLQPEPIKEEVKVVEKQQVIISSPAPIATNEVCHPYLANLISLMADSICRQKIFSAEIKDALENAFERIPNLNLIPGLNEMKKIESPHCQLHFDSQYILLTKCRKQHCLICLFEQIRKEFTKEKYHLTCNCGIQIAPKQIDEIKKLPAYKEYKKSLS